MRDVFVRTVNETYEDELREITCPVELVWGSDDTAAPVAVAERAAELLAHPVAHGAARSRAPHADHCTSRAAGRDRPAARLEIASPVSAVEAVVAVVGIAAVCVAGLRWLRVAQREHYLAGSATRFAWRWWRCTALNAALLSVGVVALVAAFVWPWFGLAAALVGVIGPVGLGVRGRTSKLAWTRRLRTVAVVSVAARRSHGPRGSSSSIGSPRPARHSRCSRPRCSSTSRSRSSRRSRGDSARGT